MSNFPDVDDIKFEIKGRSDKPAVAENQWSPAQLQVLAQLEAAIRNYESIPAKQEHLTSLIACVDRANFLFEQLLRSMPKTDPQFCVTRNWGRKVKSKAKYLRALAKYKTPGGKSEVREALSFRLTMKDGVYTAGLTATHVNETIDPRHRTGGMQKAFAAWVEDQRKNGLDPAENIVDFLLKFDSQRALSGVREMSTKTRTWFQLTFASASEGGHAMCTNYVTVGNKPRVRYKPDLAGGGHAMLSIRREAYDSEGGTHQRGGDFMGGNIYVMSTSNKFYAAGLGYTHSEFLSGAGVQCAGTMKVIKGKVHGIDNRSGHYQPNWKHLLQAVEYLAAKDVFARDAVVGLEVEGTATMFFTVYDYLRLGRNNFPHEATRQVVRGYQRRYNDAIPVPGSKLEHIPASLRSGWDKSDGNRWDLFLEKFCGDKRWLSAVPNKDASSVPKGNGTWGARPTIPTAAPSLQAAHG